MPRTIALVMLAGLAACGTGGSDPAVIASRAPGPTYACIAPKLDRLPLRYFTAETAAGWRIRIEVLSGPPTGWYSKGRIEFSDGLVAYLPDGATAGIAEQQVAPKIRPILQRCSGG